MPATRRLRLLQASPQKTARTFRSAPSVVLEFISASHYVSLAAYRRYTPVTVSMVSEDINQPNNV
jgi:hypothetical protein